MFCFLTWFISEIFAFRNGRINRPPLTQELGVYPRHLRSRLLVPALQVRLQGLHTLHSPATCPGAEVLLVHSPALHHYSKSHVLGEQIRAQWKIIHWPTESRELRLNWVSCIPTPDTSIWKRPLIRWHLLTVVGIHSSPRSPVAPSGLVTTVDRSQPWEFRSRDRDRVVVVGIGDCAGQDRRVTYSKHIVTKRWQTKKQRHTD